MPPSFQDLFPWSRICLLAEEKGVNHGDPTAKCLRVAYSSLPACSLNYYCNRPARPELGHCFVFHRMVVKEIRLVELSHPRFRISIKLNDESFSRNSRKVIVIRVREA